MEKSTNSDHLLDETDLSSIVDAQFNVNRVLSETSALENLFFGPSQYNDDSILQIPINEEIDLLDEILDYQLRDNDSELINSIGVPVIDTEEEHSRGVSKIISYLEEGAPYSGEVSSNLIYYDANLSTDGNAMFHSTAVDSAYFTFEADDTALTTHDNQQVYKLPSIDTAFHGFQNLSDQSFDEHVSIFDGTGGTQKKPSKSQKRSKIPKPVTQKQFATSLKPKKRSAPKTVTAKLNSIAENDGQTTQLLLIPMITRTSVGGTSTNALPLNDNYPDISLKSEVLEKINDLSEGKNIVQLSSSASTGERMTAVKETLPVVAPFQTKRSQRADEIQKLILAHQEEQIVLKKELEAIEKSEILVPKLVDSKERKRKQSLKVLIDDDEKPQIYLPPLNLDALNLTSASVLEQESAHRTAKSSQRKCFRVITPPLTPIHGSDYTNTSFSHENHTLASLKVRPLAIEFEGFEKGMKDTVVNAKKNKPKIDQSLCSHQKAPFVSSVNSSGYQSDASDQMIQCHICKKAFRYQTHLATHLKFHNRIHHECNYCHKHFAKPESLRNHLRFHCTKIDGFQRKRILQLSPRKTRSKSRQLVEDDQVAGRYGCRFCKKFTSNSKLVVKKHEFNDHERALLEKIKVQAKMRNNGTAADNAKEKATVQPAARRSSLRLAFSGIKPAKKQIRCLDCKFKFMSPHKFLKHECREVKLCKRRLFEKVDDNE